MKTKRVLSFLLVLISLIPTQGAFAAKKKQYVNIQELYAQTRDGWHATYIPPKGSIRGNVPDGYTITVDVPILMPDVSRVPIMEFQIDHDVLKDDPYIVSRRQPGQVREDGGVEAITFSDEDYPHFDLNAFPAAEDGQAEGNPLTLEDAEQLYYALAKRYMQVDNFRLRAISGFEANASAELYGTKLNEWHKTLEPAPYVMVGEQVFEGIPILLDGCNTDKRYFAPSHFQVELYSFDQYILGGTAFKQLDTLHEDVPLLPWSDIQKSIEDTLLTNGNMLEVYSVELGYQFIITRKGPRTNQGYLGELKKFPETTFKEIYAVRPIWLVRGWRPTRYSFPIDGVNAVASKENTLADKLGLKWYMGAAFDAQTGKLVYEHDLKPHSNSLFPTILTWADVK